MSLSAFVHPRDGSLWVSRVSDTMVDVSAGEDEWGGGRMRGLRVGSGTGLPRSRASPSAGLWSGR